jgi:hypothetical protein
LKNVSPAENGGKSNLRDDALVFSYDWNMWIRSDARYDGTKQTYWWAYTQYPLLLNVDQDGDAIKTKHELGGYDPNNDGVSDTPLHRFGASPFYKDVFVEEDYMAGPPGATWNFSMTAPAMSLAVAEMAKKGINLHIVVGNQVAYQANLGNPGFSWTTHFDPIKNANFAAARVPFFHYCLFANHYNGGSSSGISRGIPASDFIVSLGGITNLGWQAGTFLHELGHNLGLHHGGPDDTNNKPNFVSIMNYEFQASGIYKDNSYQFLYSDITCNSLNEAALNENTGVVCATGSSTYWTRICSAGDAWDQVNTNFDFNQNGALQSSVSANLNCDGTIGTLAGGNNDYNALIFNGGSIGSAAKRDVAARDVAARDVAARDVAEHDVAERDVAEERERDVAGEREEELIYEPPIDRIPAPPSNHRIEALASLKPHVDGRQFLTSTKFFPDIIKSKEHAVEVKPEGFYPAGNRRGGGNAKVNTAPVRVNVDDVVELPETPVVPADSGRNTAAFGRV